MSGIYIPGMEMPVCHFKTSESYNVHGFWIVYPDGKSKLHIMVGSDHWVCEVIPVPDHGDLIDRDKLEKDIDKYIGGEESRSRFHHWVQVQSVVIPGDKGEET